MRVQDQARSLFAPCLFAVAGLSQIGATSIPPITMAAHAAVRDFASAEPLSDPSDILDTLAIDPLRRAIDAQGRALMLTGGNAPEAKSVIVNGMSPVLAQRVANTLAVLDDTSEPVKVATPKPFSFRSILQRQDPVRKQGQRFASPSPIVASAIRQAAARTGVSETYLMKAARRESSFNAHAKAPTSSALGLYQFLTETWLQTVRLHGSKHGLDRYARAITIGADGRHTVSDAGTRYQILALRRDPSIAALMAGEFTRSNQQFLRQRLGRTPTDGETYIAHFMGADGAATLLVTAKYRPSTNAASLFPKAAQANRSIFFDRFGRPRSAAEVALVLHRKGER